MIMPLFDGITELEVIARILGGVPTDPHTLVYDTITAIAGGDAQKSFNQFLHDGLLAGSAYEKIDVSPRAASAITAVSPVKLSKDNLEVRFTVDAKVDDGRFANNGWLQECPDPSPSSLGTTPSSSARVSARNSAFRPRVGPSRSPVSRPPTSCRAGSRPTCAR